MPAQGARPLRTDSFRGTLFNALPTCGVRAAPARAMAGDGGAPRTPQGNGAELSSEEVRRRLQSRQILVVEDKVLVAMDLEDTLRQQGCEVLGPAPSVRLALAILEQQTPDAVLLDLNLNGDAAVPVAEALRARGVPFVIVSGYTAAQSPDPVLEGAPRIAKPADHRVLLRVLASVLPDA